MQPTQQREFFVVIRRNGLGPRTYPVIRHPDGRIEETTWAEYRASRETCNN